MSCIPSINLGVKVVAKKYKGRHAGKSFPKREATILNLEEAGLAEVYQPKHKKKQPEGFMKFEITEPNPPRSGKPIHFDFALWPLCVQYMSLDELDWTTTSEWGGVTCPKCREIGAERAKEHNAKLARAIRTTSPTSDRGGQETP